MTSSNQLKTLPAHQIPKELMPAALKREVKRFQEDLWRETRRKLRRERKHRFTT